MELGEICLACGLCCQGALHSKAVLRENEHEVMVRIGATIKPDGQFFVLPCPAHDGSACTVYEERPQVCADYECGPAVGAPG